MLTKRFGLVILLIFSAFFLPWWLSLPLAILGFFSFKFFIEAVLVFFIMDLMYAIPEPRFGGYMFVMSSIALLFLVAINLFKKKIIIS